MKSKAKKIDAFIEHLYETSDGVLETKNASKLKDVFEIKCKKCNEKAVLIETEKDLGSACPTCLDPDEVMMTIKCTWCGSAVSIRR